MFRIPESKIKNTVIHVRRCTRLLHTVIYRSGWKILGKSNTRNRQHRQWHLSNPKDQGTRELCRIGQDVGKLRLYF